MKKRIIVTFFCVISGILTFVSGADVNLPRGNDEQSIMAAQAMSHIEGIKRLAVLSRDNMVLVGAETLEGANRSVIKNRIGQMVKEYFPEYGRCLLGVDNHWSESVLELPFYIDGGMNRKVLEKRFEYLAQVSERKIPQNLTN